MMLLCEAPTTAVDRACRATGSRAIEQGAHASTSGKIPVVSVLGLYVSRRGGRMCPWSDACRPIMPTTGAAPEVAFRILLAPDPRTIVADDVRSRGLLHVYEHWLCNSARLREIQPCTLARISDAAPGRLLTLRMAMGEITSALPDTETQYDSSVDLRCI